MCVIFYACFGFQGDPGEPGDPGERGDVGDAGPQVSSIALHDCVHLINGLH